jgi:hypothetical protein
MAEYKIILDGLAAFVVETTGESGSRRLHRFPTEAAAVRWIAAEENCDAVAVPDATNDT